MSAALRKFLNEHEPTDLLSVSTILKHLGAEPDAEQWIELSVAARIMANAKGEPIAESTLRNRCARWERMAGPPVRVKRAGDTARSPWLLSSEDCWALARARGPRLSADTPEPAETVDDHARTLDLYARLATEGLDECQASAPKRKSSRSR